MNFIVGLVKFPRAQISSTYRVDGVEVTTINVLSDPTDSNRIYLPLSISSNDKIQQYSGQIIEIGSDDVISSSAFNNSVDQNALK